MLEVSGVEERKDCVERNLRLNVLERWGSLWNLKQENVTLLVCTLWVVTPVQSVHDNAYSIFASKWLGIFFGDIGLLVPNKLFPPDDWRLQFDFFALVVWIFNFVNAVDQEHYDRLSCHHMLLNVGVVSGVSVWVEQIKNLFFGQDLTLLVENFKVVIPDIVVESFKLLT